MNSFKDIYEHFDWILIICNNFKDFFRLVLIH